MPGRRSAHSALSGWSITRTAPAVTCSPSLTNTLSTTPAREADSVNSIFIASMTASGCPFDRIAGADPDELDDARHRCGHLVVGHLAGMTGAKRIGQTQDIALTVEEQCDLLTFAKEAELMLRARDFRAGAIGEAVEDHHGQCRGSCVDRELVAAASGERHGRSSARVLDRDVPAGIAPDLPVAERSPRIGRSIR